MMLSVAWITLLFAEIEFELNAHMVDIIRSHGKVGAAVVDDTAVRLLVVVVMVDAFHAVNSVILRQHVVAVGVVARDPGAVLVVAAPVQDQEAEAARHVARDPDPADVRTHARHVARALVHHADRHHRALHLGNDREVASALLHDPAVR